MTVVAILLLLSSKPDTGMQNLVRHR